MQNPYKNRILLLTLVVILLLSGCADVRILEELGFIHSAGYEYAEGKGENDRNNLLVTFKVLKAEETGGKGNETLTTVANSGKEARTRLDRQTNNQLVSGQFRSALFADEYARKGVWDIVDTLVRDPTIGKRSRIVVIEGSPHEILQAEFSQHPDVGHYIDQMLDKEEKANKIPNCNLYIFSRDLFDLGIDPVVPLLKIGKKSLIINGIGIFRDDRYVSKINPIDVPYFYFMKKNFKGGDLNLTIQHDGAEEQEIILLSNLISKRKIKVQRGQGDQIKVNIELNVMGSLLEYIGKLDITVDGNVHILEEAVAREVEKSAQKVVELLQSNGADSLGIGMYVRNSMTAKEWKELDYKKQYPTIDVSVQAKVVIKNIGISKSGTRVGVQ
ncbi:Ger(x)C family spore germination protein [Bacillus horti]|uniref:Spore germination protein n=1 Tax=Caldalkalibacillus horti TaxID=77523 RepID=A0ABT9VX30_9BACI|nr:Ger(x)C family spore germination protein [Bacillus horti]MDQ0165550.1 spore germination protein [Bacillus horti]